MKNTGGRAAFWLRIPGGARVPDAADLALVGDTVPAAFASATGKPISGNSLDNTIRVGTLVWTEWVLVDVQVHALVDGYGHGIAHLWAEDGTLLGTASQSAVVRSPPPDEGRPQELKRAIGPSGLLGGSVSEISTTMSREADPVGGGSEATPASTHRSIRTADDRLPKQGASAGGRTTATNFFQSIVAAATPLSPAWSMVVAVRNMPAWSVRLLVSSPPPE